MITRSRENVTAVTVTLLLAVATFFAIYFYSVKNGTEEALVTEQVKAEKMLSEKLALSKELEKLKKDVETYKGKNSELDKKLATLEGQLKKKEAELKTIARNDKALVDYKKQISELQALRDQLNEDVFGLKDQLLTLQNENSSLKNALSAMEVSNESLADRNYVLSQFIANNYGTEAHKKREKLTVNSKRAKAIVLGFDIPMDVTEKLSFTITSPDGEKVASNNSKTIKYAVKDDFEFSNSETVVSTTGVITSQTNGNKRVVLTYKPERKLERGVYKIDIYAENNYVGSSQIRLK